MLSTKSHTDLAGITNYACPAACNPEHCVISDRGFCFHPKKGGMPKSFENDPNVVTAYAAACHILGWKSERLV